MINSKQLEFMSQQGTNETDPAQLTDINPCFHRYGAVCNGTHESVP